MPRPNDRRPQRPTAVARPIQPTAASGDEVVAPSNESVLTARRAVSPFKIGWVKPVKSRINIMVYGPYGHGKTTFAASALDVPEMRDVLFIAADPGTMSLTSRRDLDVVTLNKYDQVARVYDYLVLHCAWRDQYLSPHSSAEERAGALSKLLKWEQDLKDTVVPLDEQVVPVEEGRTWFTEQRLRTGKPMDEPYLFNTVIIDSLSEVHKYLVYKFTGVDIGKTKLDEEIERMEEWQVAQEMFRLMIRSFRDLPMSAIFVSAESIEPNERNKKRNPHAGQALPKLAGQAPADVAGFVDAVGYLVREIEPGGDTHRYLYLGAGYEGWISKHRFENLPDLDYLDKPTLTSFMDLARKDAELNGPSSTRSGTATNANVAPTSHTASAAATNRSRTTAQPTSGSGSRDRAAVRRNDRRG